MRRSEQTTVSLQATQAGALINRAEIAAGLLKALSNKDRLQILCYLAERERNVSDLEGLLGLRQPTLSQQLARLRADSLVKTRRDGKAIYYSLASDEVTAVIAVLSDLYCGGDASGEIPDDVNASPGAGQEKTRQRDIGGNKTQRTTPTVTALAS